MIQLRKMFGVWLILEFHTCEPLDLEIENSLGRILLILLL